MGGRQKAPAASAHRADSGDRGELSARLPTGSHVRAPEPAPDVVRERRALPRDGPDRQQVRLVLDPPPAHLRVSDSSARPSTGQSRSLTPQCDGGGAPSAAGSASCRSICCSTPSASPGETFGRGPSPPRAKVSTVSGSTTTWRGPCTGTIET